MSPDPVGADPVTYSPYAYGIHEDPYPVYARLRAEAPLYRNDEFDFWALSRHADVLGAFRNVDGFSNAFGVSLDPSAFGPDAHRFMSFLALDPPRHTRMRSLVGKGFTPTKVAQMEDRIRAIAVEHLEPALERGSFDFIGDFAGKFPMDVISDLVGVDRADRPEIRRLADLLVHREDGVFDVPPAGMEAALTLLGYYQAMVDDRRRTPRDDLTSSLMAAEIDGDRLSEREVLLTTTTLIMAGVESLGGFMSMFALNLADFGDARRACVANPDVISDALEESLRFNTSAQRFKRCLTRDVELHGQSLKAGDFVCLAYGSGNRDERQFANAETYDIARKPKGHLGFGGGVHACLGSAIARIAIRIAVEEFHKVVPEYERVEKDLPWMPSSTFRSPLRILLAVN